MCANVSVPRDLLSASVVSALSSERLNNTDIYSKASDQYYKLAYAGCKKRFDKPSKFDIGF